MSDNIVVVTTETSVVTVVSEGPQGVPFVSPRGIGVENPTNSENLTLIFLKEETTISEIHSLVQGSSPSVTFSLRYGADRGAAGTEVVTGGITCTNTTTGLTTTSFNNATVPANNWLWLTTTAISGTVSTLHVTLQF